MQLVTLLQYYTKHISFLLVFYDGDLVFLGVTVVKSQSLCCLQSQHEAQEVFSNFIISINQLIFNSFKVLSVHVNVTMTGSGLCSLCRAYFLHCCTNS